MPVKIRDAVDSDLPAIIDIYNEAVATRITAAQTGASHVGRTARLAQGTFVRSTSVLGFENRWASCRLADCQTVHPALRLSGHGRVPAPRVARALLEEAISRATSLGINAMVGLIFAHNEPSLRLFEQFGFEHRGLLPRIARLDGIGRDLAIMGRQV